MPVCLQAFLGKGTAGIGESLQGFHGPTLRQSGDLIQEYLFVESNPCWCLRFELPLIKGSLSHTFFDLAEVQF